MQPSPGRIVHYKVSSTDADAINRRRTNHSAIRSRLAAEPSMWPHGAQAHIGNTVRAGDVFPMIVVRVWQGDLVNGQAVLDGTDTFWVTSASEGEGNGQWSWPPRSAV